MAQTAAESKGHGGGSIVAVADKDRRHDHASIELAVTLQDAAFMLPQQNLISIASSGGADVYQLAELVATGLEAPDNSSTVPQGGNDEEIIINMNPTNDPASVSTVVSPNLLPRVLLTFALLTMIMVIATTLYKPPRGVVFGHHRLVYYLTLAGIFVAGVVEALTAIWISRSHDADRHRFSFGRVVLCASIAPLVIIVAIGGFAFIDG